MIFLRSFPENNILGLTPKYKISYIIAVSKKNTYAVIKKNLFKR